MRRDLGGKVKATVLGARLTGSGLGRGLRAFSKLGPRFSHNVPGLLVEFGQRDTPLVIRDDAGLDDRFDWSFEFCWAWLRQRSLFDRGVYGSWRAADGGFEPLVMR